MDATRASAFPATQWTAMVGLCRSDDPRERRRAWENLCGNYWYPLYAFARRQGHSSQDAEDITQGFLCYALERDVLRSARQELGKLRTFLLTVFRRYINDLKTREHALKRGGGREMIPLDAEEGDARYLREMSAAVNPEAMFDRAWAVSVLAAALKALGEVEDLAGRGRQYEVLKPFLDPDNFSGSGYPSVACQLDMSEEAVRKAVSRLRKKFRDCLRAQVADTLYNPVAEQVDGELKVLISALQG